MEDERLKHLINLLRHSKQVEFHIPSILFSDHNGFSKQQKEVQEAWEQLNRDDSLIVMKFKEIKYGTIKVVIKVKQWESQ